MISYLLKVAEVRRETPDTTTLCLKQPGLKKVKYFPGQYLTLVFRINGRKYCRPYSFSSAPGVDVHLEVTVKRVPGGIVSNHVNDFVKEGDTIEVIEPMGEFIFDPALTGPETHVFLWGAGSGITPLISIVKYILAHKTGNKVCLAYGNRTWESVIFADKITGLEQSHPGDLRTFHFHSQAQLSTEYPEVILGRIDPDRVLEVMKDEAELENTVHYICGPRGLKESVIGVLRRLGVPDGSIHTEEFEVTRNPADFADITTQVVEMVQDGVGVPVEVTCGRSILEAALDAGLDIDYSCQTGSCLLCKANLVSGDVKLIGIERPEKLRESEHLLCCSFPRSSDVKIRIN